MICQVNFPNDDHTVPLIVDPQSRESMTRSPEYEAFKRMQTGAYHLLSIQSGGSEQVILLESSTYSIGRHEANSIVLNSSAISRHHATLLRLSDPKTKKYYFRIVDGDLNGKPSLNGISINDRRCSSHDLQNQDVITFSDDIKITYYHVSNSADPIYPHSLQVCELPIPILKADLFNNAVLYPKDTHRELRDSEHNVAGDSARNCNNSELYRVYSFSELTPYPIVETDLNGLVTYINPIAAVQFQEINLGQKHALLEGLLDLLQNGKRLLGIREVEYNGCIYEQSIYCILQSQLIRSYFVDITQRKQLDRQLYKSEQRFAAAARGANDGLWDWDLITNKIYFSPRWKMMMGYEEHEIDNDPDDWLNRIHPLDREKFNQTLSAHLEGQSPHFECEYRICLENDSIQWFRVRGLAIRNEHNQPERIAGSQTDITEYYKVREQLTHDALHDPMTGLPNRTLFMDRISQAIKKSRRRENYLCAVLFLDLDRFKLINDSLGHIAGDRLLIEVASRLRECLRTEDTIARLGGDEFVILLDNIKNSDDSVNIAQKILNTFRKSFMIDGQEIFSSASIGIALGGPEYDSPDELLRDADTAMYRAKHLGKNRYELFGNNLRVHALHQLNLETDLQLALERGEFSLVYQPIVDLDNHKLVGFEALVRWQHPERGIVNPVDFIPLAEETGLIVQIGWWVIREACLQMYNWILKYPLFSKLSMSVNISSKQFTQHDFVQQIRLVLEEIGLNASNLNLEITEGSVMQDPISVANKLRQIKEIGVDLMMDDFGTGYSSLNYLRTFPIDILKIDRSFINQMNNEAGLEIVKTIVNLAHNLRMQVVAEGVENGSQSQCLKELGCEYAQGYLFSRPLDGSTMEAFISELPL
jgi:diguanylate cyclase (GGDEF)-like protein/PAS domain S-box-containing protein